MQVVDAPDGGYDQALSAPFQRRGEAREAEVEDDLLQILCGDIAGRFRRSIVKGKLMRDFGVDQGRKDVMGWRQSWARAGVEQRMVLGVVVCVTQKQVRQRDVQDGDAGEAGIFGLPQDPTDGLGRKAARRGAIAFIFQARAKPESLCKIFLMQVADEGGIDDPVQACNQKAPQLARTQHFRLRDRMCLHLGHQRGDESVSDKSGHRF